MKSFYREVRGGSVRFRVPTGRGPTGKRLFKDFNTEEEATKFIQANKENDGEANTLYDKKNEIIYCMDRLSPLGATLVQATDFFILHHKHMNISAKLASKIYLDEKTKLKRNPRYLEAISYLLNRLVDMVGESKLNGITQDDIRKVIYDRERAPYTINNECVMLSGFFRWAIKRNYTTMNPVVGLEKPRVILDAPAIITPETMKALLVRCVEHKWWDRLCIIVLTAFAGCRLEEASKLTYEEIHLDTGIVHIRGGIAKKAKHRNNEISANGIEWLKLIPKREGKVGGETWKVLVRVACRPLKIPKNGLRHSFCTYYLSYHGEECLPKLTALMGHTEWDVLFKHYRNVDVKNDAAKWWSIKPSL